MIRRLCCISALVGALLAATAPAAGAATVPPGTWAPKFCAAVDRYESTISEQTDAMSAALDSVTDLKTARTEIVSFLGSMFDAAKTAKQQVSKAGTPSVPNGQKIASAFAAGLAASAKVFSDAKSQAARISTASTTAFKTDGKQVGEDLQDAGERLEKSFSTIGKLDTGNKLEQAVKAAPECAFLAS